MKKQIGFIGLGKLGLDCAEVFAANHEVRGYDIFPRKSDLVKICSLQETIDHSEWIFIAVPTPHDPGYDGGTPSSHLPPRDFGIEAVKQTLLYINTVTQPKKIVLISTVLPGTVRKQLIPLIDPRHDFIYNPYLIAMGSVKWDMVNPEMVIIGTKDGNRSDQARELMDIYCTIMQNDPRYISGTWEEAECVKIFYNTFISAKIGLANMIQDFAMRIGNIDVDRVTDALAGSTMRIMGPKYMTAGMGDAGACHPRDNIALRWLAKEYDIGYDIFDTIMLAREKQARNLAFFLIDVAEQYHLTDSIVIHGKAYKPDVPYCVGSYSTLIGHYIQENGIKIRYLDPMADDQTDVVEEILEPSVVLMAHNRRVTYGYTGNDNKDLFYCDIPKGSILVDPWRRMNPHDDKYKIIAYGNSRT